MSIDPLILLDEAKRIDADAYRRNIEEAINLLKRASSMAKSIYVEGKLVKLAPSGEVLIIGDLHGDTHSLIRILTESRYTQRMHNDAEAKIVFLGDYGDRGGYSAEVYYIITRMLQSYPEQVVLLRGNHEGPIEVPVYPHDLPIQFKQRFGNGWEKAYAETRELFNSFYNAVLVEGSLVMVHGGLSPQIKCSEDLANAGFSSATIDLLIDLLWNDPDDSIEYIAPSPRGAGHLFGRKVTETVLKKLNAQVLIRGHEPCSEGYRISHGGKVLTLFSRKGPPYFNTFGAYAKLQLSMKFNTATQLASMLHKF